MHFAMNGLQQKAITVNTKALFSKAGIAGSFHKDGTVTTDAFKQTMDARQRCANAGSRESLQYDNGS